MHFDRRRFLVTGASAAVLSPAVGVAVQRLLARQALADSGGADALASIGALMPKPDLRDGKIRLSVPEGWVYRSLSATGDMMTDGVTTPGRPDGMAAFAGPGHSIRLVRNHEERESGPPIGDSAKAYDGNTIGGTTTLEVDAATRELKADWVSLNGTTFNCAGGPTPWGTWLSCEESVNGPDVGPDFAGNGPDFAREHGFIYEVDGRWGQGEHPKVAPIRKVGRFPHEACALDPRTGILYQTEDQFLFPAGFYRYRTEANPMDEGRLLDGGTLEMLRVRGSSSPAGLGGVLAEGAVFDVDWVVIDNPDPSFSRANPPSNNDAIRNVSLQGFAKNAAMFARPEGCWYGDGLVWFACTRGGSSPEGLADGGEYGDGRGQIWRYDPMAETLTLVFQSTDPDVLDMPDNLTISPTGTVVICEDGGDGNYVRALGADGTLTSIAKNMTDRPNDEFAGAVFSPDGRTLFVNIQAKSGTTFAIWREGDTPLL